MILVLANVRRTSRPDPGSFNSDSIKNHSESYLDLLDRQVDLLEQPNQDELTYLPREYIRL